MNGVPESQGYSGAKSIGENKSDSTPPNAGDQRDDATKKQQQEEDEQHGLDSIIPWPASYEGHDHPFKTVLERNQEIAHTKYRELILGCFQNGATNHEIESDSFTETTEDSDTQSLSMPVEDRPTTLQQRLPQNPSSKKLNRLSLKHRQVNSQRLKFGSQSRFRQQPIKESSILLKKKRGRKSKAEIAALAVEARNNSQAELDKLKKNRRLPNHARNVIDKTTLDTMSKKEVPITNLRSSVETYFGAAERLASGEKVKVMARRITPDGKIQHLVEWQGGLF